MSLGDWIKNRFQDYFQCLWKLLQTEMMILTIIAIMHSISKSDVYRLIVEGVIVTTTGSMTSMTFFTFRVVGTGSEGKWDTIDTAAAYATRITFGFALHFDEGRFHSFSFHFTLFYNRIGFQTIILDQIVKNFNFVLHRFPLNCFYVTC